MDFLIDFVTEMFFWADSQKDRLVHACLFVGKSIVGRKQRQTCSWCYKQVVPAASHCRCKSSQGQLCMSCGLVA